MGWATVKILERQKQKENKKVFKPFQSTLWKTWFGFMAYQP